MQVPVYSDFSKVLSKTNEQLSKLIKRLDQCIGSIIDEEVRMVVQI